MKRLLAEAWANLWDFTVVRDRMLQAEMSDEERAACLIQIRDFAWIRNREIERELTELHRRYAAGWAKDQVRANVVSIKGWAEGGGGRGGSR